MMYSPITKAVLVLLPVDLQRKSLNRLVSVRFVLVRCRLFDQYKTIDHLAFLKDIVNCFDVWPGIHVQFAYFPSFTSDPSLAPLLHPSLRPSALSA